MPVYRYTKTVLLKKDEDAVLDISFGQAGTAAHHLIDLPGPNDKQAMDQCSENIGNLNQLSKERTIIFTKAVNVNPNSSDIEIEYKINNQSVAKHSNPKTEDRSPLILVTLRFKEAKL